MTDNERLANIENDVKYIKKFVDKFDNKFEKPLEQNIIKTATIDTRLTIVMWILGAMFTTGLPALVYAIVRKL